MYINIYIVWVGCRHRTSHNMDYRQFFRINLIIKTKEHFLIILNNGQMTRKTPELAPDATSICSVRTILDLMCMYLYCTKYCFVAMRSCRDMELNK